MQPYFAPYAGYFRLFCGVDAFVVLDSVQFARRGWVHRNRLFDHLWRPRHLTVPLQYAPVETPIREMRLAPTASDVLLTRARRFPACTKSSNAAASVIQAMSAVQGDLVDYLMRLLLTVSEELRLPKPPIIRSSEIVMPEHVVGQARILEICRQLGASHYLNAPGGRLLYEPETFSHHGVSLEFLTPHQGSEMSILQRLHDESAEALRAEILNSRYA